MLVPPELDNLVSSQEAATKCGVTVDAIYQWKLRGHITPSDLDVNGRPLYKLIDILRASRDTKRRALGSRRVA